MAGSPTQINAANDMNSNSWTGYGLKTPFFRTLLRLGGPLARLDPAERGKLNTVLRLVP